MNRETNGNFYPVAANILARLPEDALFYKEHQLRHPAAIYFLSLEKISRAFLRVIGEYSRKRLEYRFSSGPEIDIAELLREQVGLLRALQEHLDDCYLILKTLIEPKSTIKSSTLFADRFVIESKLAGAKAFQTSVVNFKASLLIANKLKHQQGVLQGVLVSPGANLGYYLEVPGPDGALGPSTEVHPDQGCFSFARDLPYRLFQIYQCSAWLKTAVSKAVHPDRWVVPPPLRNRSELPWDELIKLMEELPLTIFPKELARGLPTFRTQFKGNVLSITQPNHLARLTSRQSSLSLKLTLDGYSNMVKPPMP